MARTTGKTLDPRDAPRGYLAKRAYRFCTGCAFETEEGPVRCSRPELLRSQSGAVLDAARRAS